MRLFHDCVAVYLFKELLPCRMDIVRRELFCDTLHGRLFVLNIIILPVCCPFVVDVICSWYQLYLFSCLLRSLICLGIEEFKNSRETKTTDFGVQTRMPLPAMIQKFLLPIHTKDNISMRIANKCKKHVKSTSIIGVSAVFFQVKICMINLVSYQGWM